MKVSGLVEERMVMHNTYSPIDESVEGALVDLGLWDAEVLEATVGEETNGLLALWPEPLRNKEWHDAGVDRERHVRVIVLPVKEEE